MKQQAGSFLRFQALHHGDAPLVLGNAWDAMSATMLVQAGFAAIGTTSAGIAASLGWPDNEELPVEQLCQAVERMARVIPVPLSVDIESGYYSNELQFRAFIARLLDVGVAGVNIQDACGIDVELIAVSEMERRIECIRNVCERRNQSIFINARTDVFWVSGLAGHSDAGSLAIDRLLAYRGVGADCIFLPGLKDLVLAREMALACALPMNLLAHAGLPDLGELKAYGVSRISLGSGMFRTLYSDFRDTAGRLAATGQFGVLREPALSYEDLNAVH